MQVHEATIAGGAYPSPLNYYSFPKSVCTSVNEVSHGFVHGLTARSCWQLVWVQVICHGVPDKRPLQHGDIVNVDVSVCLNGYHGDLNETYVVGDADEESKRLVRSTLEVCY